MSTAAHSNATLVHCLLCSVRTLAGVLGKPEVVVRTHVHRVGRLTAQPGHNSITATADSAKCQQTVQISAMDVITVSET